MQGELRVLPRHLPFLPSDTATSLLERIQESVPRSESSAQSADMPLSSNVEQILTVSSELRHSLQSKEVTPLHLLLAVLMNGSHTRVQALRNLGITEERVQNAIRTENQE
jgi:ATP-dependent Clp protease ATP-binding subunit ClpA